MSKSTETYHCHVSAIVAWENFSPMSNMSRALDALLLAITDQCKSPADAVPLHLAMLPDGSEVAIIWQFNPTLQIGVAMHADGERRWTATAGGVGFDDGSMPPLTIGTNGWARSVGGGRCCHLQYGPRQVLETLAAMFPGPSQEEARQYLLSGLDDTPFGLRAAGSFAADWGKTVDAAEKGVNSDG